MKQHPNKRTAEKTKNPCNIFCLLIIETQWIRFYCLKILRREMGGEDKEQPHLAI